MLHTVAIAVNPKTHGFSLWESALKEMLGYKPVTHVELEEPRLEAPPQEEMTPAGRVLHACLSYCYAPSSLRGEFSPENPGVVAEVVKLSREATTVARARAAELVRDADMEPERVENALLVGNVFVGDECDEWCKEIHPYDPQPEEVPPFVGGLTPREKRIIVEALATSRHHVTTNDDGGATGVRGDEFVAIAERVIAL